MASNQVNTLNYTVSNQVNLNLLDRDPTIPNEIYDNYIYNKILSKLPIELHEFVTNNQIYVSGSTMIEVMLNTQFPYSDIDLYILDNKIDVNSDEFKAQWIQLNNNHYQGLFEPIITNVYKYRINTSKTIQLITIPDEGFIAADFDGRLIYYSINEFVKDQFDLNICQITFNMNAKTLSLIGKNIINCLKNKTMYISTSEKYNKHKIVSRLKKYSQRGFTLAFEN